jgi:hypothetical protein
MTAIGGLHEAHVERGMKAKGAGKEVNDNRSTISGVCDAEVTPLSEMTSTMHLGGEDSTRATGLLAKDVTKSRRTK